MESTKTQDFLSIIAAGEAFTDKEFPPNEASLGSHQKTYSWKRAKEHYKGKYEVFQGISISDIQQRELGDCYYLCSVSAIAEYPERIQRLFLVQQMNEAGCYAVTLYIRGSKTTIVVDDYFPFKDACEDWAFVKSPDAEIWVNILEKAWAKINGSYERIVSGDTREALIALTGAPTTYLNHADTPLDKVWAEISKADQRGYIMTSSGKVETQGLQANHAYSLIQAIEVEPSPGKVARIVKLRNPWGEKEWEGDWSDNDPRWTAELRKTLNYYPKDDGEFYMGLESFHNLYKGTAICKYENSYIRTEVTIKAKSGVVAFQVLETTRGFLSVYQSLMRHENKSSTIPYLVNDIYTYEDDKWKTSGEFGITDSFGQATKEVTLVPGIYLMAGLYRIDPNPIDHLCFVAYTYPAINFAIVPGKESAANVTMLEANQALETIGMSAKISVPAPIKSLSRKCLNGHPLVYMNAGEGSFTCDRCRKSKPKIYGSNRCVSCNYDACLECLPREPVEKIPENVVPESPEIEMPINEDPGHVHVAIEEPPAEVPATMEISAPGEISVPSEVVVPGVVEAPSEIAEIKEEEKKGSCQRDHPLSWGTFENKSMPSVLMCSWCNKITQPTNGAWICDLCNTYICNECSAETGHHSEEIGGCSLAQVSMISVCDANHELSFTTYSYGGGYFGCNKCGSTGKCSDGRYCCLKCEYDICQKCRPAPSSEVATEESKEERKCPRKHIMCFSKTPYPTSQFFRCNVCHRTSQAAEGRYWCHACSYDLCLKCSDILREEIQKKLKEEKDSICTTHLVLGCKKPLGLFICDVHKREVAAKEGKFICANCGLLLCKACVNNGAMILKDYSTEETISPLPSSINQKEQHSEESKVVTSKKVTEEPNRRVIVTETRTTKPDGSTEIQVTEEVEETQMAEEANYGEDSDEM